MSTAQINAVRDLVAHREAGGYTLPPELVAAWERHSAVRALTVPPPDALHVDTAGARLVAAVERGEDVDVAAFGREVMAADADRKAVDTARRVLAAAVGQSATATVLLAADLVETVIVKHLRPAHDAVLAEVDKVAADLGGRPLEPRALLDAPAPARKAFARLSELAARRSATWQARKAAVFVGGRKLVHDGQDRFAEFRTPQAVNGYQAGSGRWPGVPQAPADPPARLLWLVSDEGRRAGPWLPTTAEQARRGWSCSAKARRCGPEPPATPARSVHEARSSHEPGRAAR
jgi:hypothetical protein